MTIPFNADEIFEIAERIEHNGAAFYRKAASLSSDPQARQVLLDLASMEQRHLETFTAMRAALSRSEWKPVFDPDRQTVLYLRSIADGHIFNAKANPAESLTGRESPQEVLRLAIGLEKDSVIFYQELRQIVPERMGRDRLERIIGEEFRHITVLNEELAKLNRR